ncbi:hypothetical protein ACQKII_01405 [Lysinibacillus sp. NPDC048646]|uniref:hypothetical protein n=1 Tax=Lysinibacillus sp. NPDC048646 TaxID=3390574 RepID=UPI003D02D0A0
MQKKLFSMIALLLTAVLFVGCNTSDKSEESDAEQNEPANTASEQKPTESGTVDKEQETPTTDESKTNAEAKPQQETEINYVQKGEDKSATATESKSVDQGYKVQQLPGFTLSQEEPGKDMLVSNENDEVFMRIETTTASETSYDAVKTSMQDYMNAVGDTAALSTEELAAFKDVKNIESYVVHFDTDKVIGVVFEKDGLISKITIHDNDEQDLTAAMLAMAATISKK